jgi:hypothetical protein
MSQLNEDSVADDSQLARDCLRLLGVKPGASRAELRAAYWRQMRELAGADNGVWLDPQRRFLATRLAVAYDCLCHSRTAIHFGYPIPDPLLGRQRKPQISGRSEPEPSHQTDNVP